MDNGGKRMQLTMNNNTSKTATMTPQVNQGGHSVFDVHEVLSGIIDTLDQYLLLQQHTKDPELVDIINRQHQFILDQYNIMVESFKSGQDPSRPTSSYKMTQSNEVVYGLNPSQPRKPIQNVSELNEQGISGHMLGLLKQGAGSLTMASLECTNPVLRRILADSIPNFVEMAYEVFLYQNKHQYYQVPQLAPQDMQQLLNGYAPGANRTMMN